MAEVDHLKNEMGNFNGLLDWHSRNAFGLNSDSLAFQKTLLRRGMLSRTLLCSTPKTYFPRLFCSHLIKKLEGLLAAMFLGGYEKMDNSDTHGQRIPLIGTSPSHRPNWLNFDLPQPIRWISLAGRRVVIN